MNRTLTESRQSLINIDDFQTTCCQNVGEKIYNFVKTCKCSHFVFGAGQFGRSQKILQNEFLLPIIGFDIAEKEPYIVIIVF